MLSTPLYSLENMEHREVNKLPKVTQPGSCKSGISLGVACLLNIAHAAPHCKNFLVRRALNSVISLISFKKNHILIMNEGGGIQY